MIPVVDPSNGLGIPPTGPESGHRTKAKRLSAKQTANLAGNHASSGGSLRFISFPRGSGTPD